MFCYIKGKEKEDCSDISCAYLSQCSLENIAELANVETEDELSINKGFDNTRFQVVFEEDMEMEDNIVSKNDNVENKVETKKKRKTKPKTKVNDLNIKAFEDMFNI